MESANEKYGYILVRFGELSTKGKNKKDFIRQLTRNVKYALSAYPQLEYRNDRDRLYIFLNDTDPVPVSQRLKDVFGIRSFSLAIKCEPEMEAIKQAALYAAQKEWDEGKRTFKVMARRNDKSFPFVSDQINRFVAGRVLHETELKVDVHNPDFPLIVEIHKDAAYIMAHTELGAGGYPVRVGGRAMMLLSGGIDSPVAAYEIMKRGVMIECVHFASQPYTSEQAKEKVLTLAKMLSRYQGPVRVHVVPFTDLQLAIYDHCPENYAITIMRRMMVRIAEELAKKNKCLALVTGESVGQVASQTLESMGVINEVIKLPVIRPVATWDKLEIIAKAREIGTYETSILPFEDCCTIFTPKDPVTKPRSDRAEQYESRFDWKELLDKAVENTETVTMSEE